MEKAVLALKMPQDKKGVRTLAYQISHMTTIAAKGDVKFVDCLVTYGDVKDIVREFDQICERKHVDSFMMYAPLSLVSNLEEYYDLVSAMSQRNVDVVTVSN